jgi:uncharacterized Zn finger protein (UPF0148 family)
MVTQYIIPEDLKRTCPHCQYSWTPRKKQSIRCPICQKLLMTKEDIIKLRKGE